MPLVTSLEQNQEVYLKYTDIFTEELALFGFVAMSKIWVSAKSNLTVYKDKCFAYRALFNLLLLRVVLAAGIMNF